MQHVDEGTIHAWLDGALPADEATRVDAHVADCPDCSAAAAEARGLMAASSRIMTALDHVPRGVIPRTAAARPRGHVARRYGAVAAAITALAVGVGLMQRAAGPPSAERTVTAPVASTSRPDAASEIATPLRAPAAGAAGSQPAAPESDRAAAKDAAKEPVRASNEVVARRFGTAAESRSSANRSVALSERTAAEREQAEAPRPPAATPAPAEQARDARRNESAARVQAKAGMGASAAGAPVVENAPADEMRKRVDTARRQQEAQVARAAAPAARADALGATVAPAPGIVHGRVIDGATGKPVEGATVSLVGSAIGTRTGADGRYALQPVAPGRQTVRVRRIGYQPNDREVEARGGDTVNVDVALRVTSVGLEEVAVTSTGIDADPPVREAEGLVPLTTETATEQGRRVRRTVYELRPGVRLTLREAAPRALSDSLLARQYGAGRVAARARLEESRSNSITWSGRDGREFTLSGPLSVSELRAIQQRIGVREE